MHNRQTIHGCMKSSCMSQIPMYELKMMHVTDAGHNQSRVPSLNHPLRDQDHCELFPPAHPHFELVCEDHAVSGGR